MTLRRYSMSLLVKFTYSLLAGLTAVYCVLLWYGAGIWAIFFINADYGNIPLMSQLCLAPLPLSIWWRMIHWQFPAIISLVFCISWGMRCSRKENNDAGHVLPIVTHILWIFFAICCHLLAAVMPMLAVGHIIK